jgi:DNA-binding LytR/AlgR family response regulator
VSAERGRLRVLIVEDEKLARSYLVELVEASGLAHVVLAAPSLALAGTIAPTDIDVALVDVHLVGEANAERAGLNFARTLAASTQPPAIVLTTASNAHALEAFSFGAVDYLLKPFVRARVNATLERVLERRVKPLPLLAKPVARFAARKGKGYVFLHAQDAQAFEAEGRLAYVHTAGARYDVDLSLTAMESLLGDGFVRVHRSWLVCLAMVREVERDGGEMTLVLGQADSAAGTLPLRVPVARDRISAVKQLLLGATIGIRREDG